MQTKKRLIWFVLPLSLSISLVSFGCTQNNKEEEEVETNEDKELEYRKKVVTEAVVTTKRKYEDSQKNFNDIKDKIFVVESQLNAVITKKTDIENTINTTTQEKEVAEKEIITLENQIAKQKIGYPQIWENKRTAAAEMQAAKKEYENEKNAVVERLELVTAVLENTKSSFLLFPTEIEKVSKETYISHVKEFFLYTLGLKLLWGIFTGYRATFVYPNQEKIDKAVNKYRNLANKAVNTLNQVSELNFAKVLKNEFEKVHGLLAIIVNKIEAAPATFIELKDNLRLAKVAFEASGARKPLTEDEPKSTEYLNYEEAQNKLGAFVESLNALSLDLTNSINELIQKYTLNEKAPLKRTNFEKYRELFLEAEAAEKAHQDSENKFKDELNQKKKLIEELKGKIEKLSQDLVLTKKEETEVQERYDNLMPQKDRASKEVERTQKEYEEAREEEKDYKNALAKSLTTNNPKSTK